MAELIRLDLFDLALALALMAMAIALSIWQKLGLGGQLVLAAARTILQLLVAGYLLAFVFALNNPGAVLLTLGVMLTIATIVTRNRIDRHLKLLFPVVWASLLASTTLTMSYLIFVIIQPDTWYNPQYLIPLGGMVMGNAMNAATLAGDRLVSAIKNSPIEIATHLSLGATPSQAVFSYRQEAIRASLIPLLNQMMVVGLVSLPGMLTGQVLSGADPLDAVLYQILILFAIAFADLVTVLLVTKGVTQQFFNKNYQLLRE